MRGTLVGGITVAAMLLVGTGCSSESSTPTTTPQQALHAQANDFRAERPAPTGTLPLPKPPPVTVGPPITFPTPTPDAAAVVSTVKEKLLLDDHEQACVSDRLSRDTELLEQLKGGTAEGTPSFDDLARLGGDCTRAITFAPAFATQLNESRNGVLTSEQFGCIQSGFAALSAEDVDALVQGASKPNSPETQTATDLLGEVLDRCGVPREL